MIKLTSKLKPHKNIRLDHRTVLKVLDLIENVELFLPFKQQIIQKLVFVETPKQDKEIIEQLKIFFEAINGDGIVDTAPKGKKTLDLLKDYEYIYQSFALIGIDLHTDLMHWYKFNETLQGLLLKGDCPIAKVVEIRNIDPSDYPREKRAAIYKMKKQFALGGNVLRENSDDFVMAFKRISKPPKEVK